MIYLKLLLPFLVLQLFTSISSAGDICDVKPGRCSSWERRVDVADEVRYGKTLTEADRQELQVLKEKLRAEKLARMSGTGDQEQNEALTDEMRSFELQSND